jgi:acetylornithine deacetylase
MTQTQDAIHAEARSAVGALSGELIAFLQSLVRSPSVSGGEQAAQETIAAKYRAIGLETELLISRREAISGHPAFCDDGIPFVDRTNVVARWRGTGGGRSLILNGHMDVVPPGDIAQWTHGPWSGDIVDGRLYGRGACDMKAGLAAAAIAVQALREIGFTPRGDILLESVIGEESGGVGTLTTIVAGYRADACVIMEPTALVMCPIQSGALTFRITVHGRAAHACVKPSGVSAIEEFAPILDMLQRLNAERHARFRHPLYEDPANVAPISVGTVHSGDWHSTVPDLLVAEGRFGVFPGESVEDARRALADAIRVESARHAWLAAHPPELEWFEGQFESGETATDAPIIATVARQHAEVVGRPAEMRAVTFGSDLRLFTRHAGIPTVTYGPGSFTVAHTADEFVPVAEVIACARILAGVIVDWCGG